MTSAQTARAIGRLMSLWMILLAVPASGQIVVQPPPPAWAAKVLRIHGSVSVYRDRQPWALQLNDSVQAHQWVKTGPDGYALFQVSDGSTFEVYPDSEVTFRPNPGNWRDLLDVWIGRVKIHIEKLGGMPNPQKVRTPTALISVRGTVFDVMVDPDEDSTFVAVEEGQVAVYHALIVNDVTKLLNPGDTLRVYRDVALEARRFDKLNLMQRALRVFADAMQNIALRPPQTGGGGPVPPGTPGGGLPGDTVDPANRPGGPGTPPPPPPPPPAPPN